jgi:type IV secretion system protein VirB8
VGQGAAQAAATDGSNPGAIGIQQQQQQQASSTVTASSAAQPIQTDAVAPPATANGPVASAMSAFNPLQWFPGATGAPAPTPAAGNSQAPAAAPAPTNQANV